nr:PREDICTED: phospholipase B-like 1 [Latimeria chalumnae]|eukprot:XP_014349037.1 PREDICTED: phospholipase B-like 1 [Latimeria chalumnae]
MVLGRAMPMASPRLQLCRNHLARKPQGVQVGGLSTSGLGRASGTNSNSESMTIEATLNPVRASASAEPEFRQATIFWDSAQKTIQIKNGIMDLRGDAYGFFNDSVQSTGWGVLEIQAGYGSQSINNKDIMYLAGFLEGYLTARRVYDHYRNMFPAMIKSNTTLTEVATFLREQDQWMRIQIKKNKDSPFWRHAKYVLNQLDGLYLGIREWAKETKQEPLSFFDLQFVNAIGDLLDLILNVFTLSSSDHESEGFPGYRQEIGHCSALIKVLPGCENIYMAHSSWFLYAASLRIYKHWDFNIIDPSTAAIKASFSSYPGERHFMFPLHWYFGTHRAEKVIKE